MGNSSSTELIVKPAIVVPDMNITTDTIEECEDMFINDESDDLAVKENMEILMKQVPNIPIHSLTHFWNLEPTERDHYLDTYGFPDGYVFGTYPNNLKSIETKIDDLIYVLDKRYGLVHIITRSFREKLILYSAKHRKSVLRTHLRKYIGM